MTAPYSGQSTRRNLISFLFGKIPNAFATAGLLAILARALSGSDLGYYVVAMATIELCLGLSTFGLDWVLLRFVPEYRVNGGRVALVKLICKVIVFRCMVLLIVAGGLWATLTWIVPGVIGVPAKLAAPLAVLLVAEGANRLLRDNCFEALAMQSMLQLCTLLRSMIVIATLLFVETGTAELALFAEIGASCSSFIVAVCVLQRHLRQLPPEPGRDWKPPSVRQMRGVALHNYANGIAEYLYSTSFLILILSRFQSATAMAGLGFVLRLIDIIRNYMPGMVMFSVVRARMIGAYAVNKDYDELQNWAAFVYKVSMLTLLPVLAMAIVYGDLLLQLASGGRFAEFHMLFAVLCGWLVLRLHRLILNVVCNAVGLMSMWARAAACSLFVLPILYLFGVQHHGTWIVPAALIGSELIINVLVVQGMYARGKRWPLGVAWWLRALISAVLACAVVWALPANSTAALMMNLAVLCIVYGCGLLVAGTVSLSDKQLINRVIGKQIFRIS